MSLKTVVVLTLTVLSALAIQGRRGDDRFHDNDNNGRRGPGNGGRPRPQIGRPGPELTRPLPPPFDRPCSPNGNLPLLFGEGSWLCTPIIPTEPDNEIIIDSNGRRQHRPFARRPLWSCKPYLTDSPTTEATETSSEATENSSEATETSSEATENSSEATETSSKATETSSKATETSSEAMETTTE